MASSTTSVSTRTSFRGSAFDFAGVSIIGWSFNAPASVGIRAYDASNTLVGDTGLVGINTSAYTYVQADFAGVNRLEFYGGQFFAIDDLQIGKRDSNVPLPATLPLALLGLGLLGVSLRQRRAARG
jgi:hypothetical protein